MSILEILIFLAGVVFLFFAPAFTYYVIRNAEFMFGPLGYKLMAIGSILYFFAGIFGVIDFLAPQFSIRLLTLFSGCAALLFLVLGGLRRYIYLRKVHKISLAETMAAIPYARSYFIAMAVLAFAALPAHIFDMLQRPVLSLFTLVVSSSLAFAFVCLFVAERRFHLALHSAVGERATKEEILLLREDILAVRYYTALTNAYLTATRAVIGDKQLQYILTEHFEDNPILFEDCKLSTAMTINAEPIQKNLEHICESDRVETVCKTFSMLNSKIMILYGTMTSPKLAEKVLTDCYLSVKKQYGDAPILLEILRSLPEGVLEDAKIALLSKEELEVMVRGRTAELEKILADMKKAKESVEEMAKAEKRRADELKEARDVMFSILEDVYDAHKELGRVYKELEKSAEARATAEAERARAEVAEKFSRDLEKAYKELKTLDGAKTEFIAIASHELKTPLTIIHLYLKLFQDGTLGKISNYQKEKVENMIKVTNRLIEIVGNLLTLTAIETGKLTILKEKLLIRDVIKEICEEMEPLAKEKNLKILVKVPDNLPSLLGDSRKIGVVVRNLIDNAIKYSPSGGEIVLQAEDIGKYIHVVVIDKGIGMAPDVLEKIFGGFYAGEEHLKRIGSGMGLGLSICKGIIEAHNGKIWAESKLNVGSKFHFTLPKEEV